MTPEEILVVVELVNNASAGLNAITKEILQKANAVNRLMRGMATLAAAQARAERQARADSERTHAILKRDADKALKDQQRVAEESGKAWDDYYRDREKAEKELNASLQKISDEYQSYLDDEEAQEAARWKEHGAWKAREAKKQAADQARVDDEVAQYEEQKRKRREWVMKRIAFLEDQRVKDTLRNELKAIDQREAAYRHLSSVREKANRALSTINKISDDNATRRANFDRETDLILAQDRKRIARLAAQQATARRALRNSVLNDLRNLPDTLSFGMWHISGGVQGIIQSFKNVIGPLRAIWGQIVGAATSAINTIISILGRLVAAARNAALVIGGVLAAAFTLTSKAGLEMYVSMRQAQTGLTLITGSGRMATNLLAALRVEAVNSMLTLKEIIPVGQTLAAAFGPGGIGKVIPTIRAFGDAAMALGATPDMVSRALIQLQQLAVAPRINMQDIRVMSSDLRVNLLTMIRDAFGTADTRMLAQAGVTGEMAVNAIVAGMQRQFGGMQAMLANTLPMIMQRLRDTFDILAETLTTNLAPAWERFMGAVLWGFSSLANNPRVVEALRVAFDLLAAALETAARFMPHIVNGLAAILTKQNIVAMIANIASWFRIVVMEVMRFISIVSGGRTFANIWEAFRTFGLNAIDLVLRAWNAFVAGIEYIAKNGEALWNAIKVGIESVKVAIQILIGVTTIYLGLMITANFTRIVAGFFDIGFAIGGLIKDMIRLGLVTVAWVASISGFDITAILTRVGIAVRTLALALNPIGLAVGAAAATYFGFKAYQGNLDKKNEEQRRRQEEEMDRTSPAGRRISELKSEMEKLKAQGRYGEMRAYQQEIERVRASGQRGRLNDNLSMFDFDIGKFLGIDLNALARKAIDFANDIGKRVIDGIGRGLLNANNNIPQALRTFFVGLHDAVKRGGATGLSHYVDLHRNFVKQNQEAINAALQLPMGVDITEIPDRMRNAYVPGSEIDYEKEVRAIRDRFDAVRSHVSAAESYADAQLAMLDMDGGGGGGVSGATEKLAAIQREIELLGPVIAQRRAALIGQAQALLALGLENSEVADAYWDTVSDFWSNETRDIMLANKAKRAQLDLQKEAANEQLKSSQEMANLRKTQFDYLSKVDWNLADQFKFGELIPRMMDEFRTLVTTEIAGEANSEKIRRLNDAEKIRKEIFEAMSPLKDKPYAFLFEGFAAQRRAMMQMMRQFVRGGMRKLPDLPKNYDINTGFLSLVDPRWNAINNQLNGWIGGGGGRGAAGPGATTVPSGLAGPNPMAANAAAQATAQGGAGGAGPTYITLGPIYGTSLADIQREVFRVLGEAWHRANPKPSGY